MGLADEICQAEGKGTVEAFTDELYAEANPQGQGPPYKYTISEMIINKIKGSKDWKDEVKAGVDQVIGPRGKVQRVQMQLSVSGFSSMVQLRK
jgi:hypothetical protein